MSVYLDLARFLAALVVFLGHAAGARLTGGFLWQFGAYTGEAVAVFFVLSGFVIGHATRTREDNAEAYALARSARLASVAVPALLATFALDAAGWRADPGLYGAEWGFQADGRLQQFLAGLFFTNRLWWLHIPQGSNLSFWSLGYEAWYYVVFGFVALGPPRWRWLAAGAALIAAGPPVASLFPLWAMGLAAYHVCAGRRVPARWGPPLYAASWAIWAGYEWWAGHHGRTTALGIWLARPEWMQDYIVGSCFALGLIGLRALPPACTALLEACAGPIRWVAGTTFTLYLFHLPVTQAIAAFCQGVAHLPPDHWASRAAVLGGTLAVVALAAEFTERRKRVWREAIAWLARRIAAGLPRAVGLLEAAR